MFPSANAGLVVRINVLSVLVPSEEHLAVKPMLLRKYLGQHGHAFLRAVFLVSRNKHDGLALAGTLAALEFEDFLAREGNKGR